MSIPTLKLGSQGLVVSKIGFGCMGITAFYGAPMKDEDALSLLKVVYDGGCRHFDTAEIYRSDNPFGPATAETQYNETIVGKFVQSVPRDSVTVATKFYPLPGRQFDLASVESAVDASLARLGLSYIDLYYLHRMPKSVEQLKEWMASVKQLVQKGKIKYVGLSEVSPAWLREAHKVFPVSAVQQEWSLLTRSLVEEVLVPACVELGIAIVAYSPLARNLLADQKEAPKDWRASAPRFQPENFEKNKKLTSQITELGKSKSASASELSLAWLYQRAKELGVTMIAIPGTTKAANAQSNIRALQVSLSESDMKTLGELGALSAGARGGEDYVAGGLEGQLAAQEKQKATESKTSVPTIKLGTQGLEVGKIGFGCMGITVFQNPMKDEDAVALMQAVHARGVTHFDTAEIYRTNFGAPPDENTRYNEEVVGKFIRSVPRDSVSVATKFMPQLHKKYDLETVEKALDTSLGRLGLPFVDVYYSHRMPETLENLKQWVSSVAQLVKKGKVKYVGLSEVPPSWLREAHKVFPISVIQQEWSLLTRSPIEEHLVPVCKELGIGIVAYSPLARNLLTAAAGGVYAPLAGMFPRHSPENLKKNEELTAQITELGKSKNASASELSLAWLYHRAKELGVEVLPIPGTTKQANAFSNIRSLEVALSASDMQKLAELGTLVAGDRAADAYKGEAVEAYLSKPTEGSS